MGVKNGYSLPPVYINVGNLRDPVRQRNWIIHETGHWVQYQAYGGLYYYGAIVPFSMISQGLSILTMAYGIMIHLGLKRKQIG
jgi:Zn-dependent membrane protease YugP